MPRYLFDVHADGSADWDDQGVECDDPRALEGHARALMARIATAQGDDVKPVTAYAIQEDGDGGVVLSTFMCAARNVRLVWG